MKLILLNPSNMTLVLLELQQTVSLMLIRSGKVDLVLFKRYTRNSSYERNLNTSLSSVPPNIDTNGFYNASTGENPDRVNVIALCRADLQPSQCRDYVENATAEILKRCPNKKQAILWHEFCMVRYSDEAIFGTLANSPMEWGYSGENITNTDVFYRELNVLLNSLHDHAAFNSSPKKFAAATRDVNGSNRPLISAFEQCTPDITSEECRDCLNKSAQQIRECCEGARGVRILRPSCYLRFETDQDPFYNVSMVEPVFQPQTPPSRPPQPPGKQKNTSRTIIIVIIPIVLGLILALCIGIYLKTKKNHKPWEEVDLDEEISTVESLQYDFGTIRVATDNFSDANKLGQGGFGVVYKGKLPKGNEIAVKRVSHDSGQGDLEFKNENGSLDRFIFDSNNPCLDWEKRYIIISGVAKGLLYLHEDSRLRIIHRDLKASNVLLDEEMNPKISDFGMARLFVPNETQHSTSRIVGTYGYMAPEYVIHGHFSIKSDVYSFGVLILEIISGQKAYNFQNGEGMDDLISFVWKNWHQGTVANIIDPALRTSSGSMSDITRCIHIGLLCVQDNAADRPTMGSVVLMLSSFSLTLTVPSQPAFFMSDLFGSVKSQNYPCGENGTYMSNSTFSANLNTLLSSVSSNIDTNGFYNASMGEYADRVNAIALCRGDVQLDICRSCIYNATRSILQLCPYKKQATFRDPRNWCMLRYSDEYIFGTLVTFPDFYTWNTKNVSDPDDFFQDLTTLLNNLQSQAAYGGSLKKFAAANRTRPDSLTIYGLMQCTPDLPSEDCRDCLIQVSQVIPRCCNGKPRFGIFTPSCILQYDTSLFYNYTPQPPPALAPPPPPPPSVPVREAPILAPPGEKILDFYFGNDVNKTRTIIIKIVPIVVGLILAVCIGIVLRIRRQSKTKEIHETDNEISTVESLQYEFGTIRAATNSFSDANKLGQGGFGVVYKGKLPSRQEIAVKRLSMNSAQERSERLLVYEFIENGSLDRFIFDPIKRQYLDWDTRYKIIGGVAKGLLYLHDESQLRIIHRDLKASNVLIDGEMNPKISDFGMARLIVQDETQGSTNRIVGTYGYMAPEKCIMYRKSYTYNRSGKATHIIDPLLRTSDGSLCDILRCIHIGLLCVQENAADRPTMATIVLMLTSYSITLPIPSRPAFFVFSSLDPEISLFREQNSRPKEATESSKNRSSNSIDASVNDVTMSELYPR
ncbi:unnamed protein product [Fraxinus pennsylvanica]|uniref:Cysteine-rich receptor-like protein kinase n=1 Tax=Fraxinus pennsylvanica TaxID=56036 RepID=A0AAD2AM16_9LAMI|nr:unnamed protein product [Fraxinus pennsylvanica]